MSALSQFFSQAKLAPLLSDGEKARLEDFNTKPHDPLFVDILVGAGAWIASVFIMVFIGASGIVGDETGAIALGIAAIVIGLALRQIQATFTNQLSLALVSTAYILIMYGAANILNHDEVTLCLIIHLGLTILLYPLYNSSIYRFLAPFTLYIFAFFWIGEEHHPNIFHLLVFCQVTLISLLLHQSRWSLALRPLAYSALFGLPTIFMLQYGNHFGNFGHDTLTPSWPSSILLCAALILLICFFSPKWRSDPTSRVAILIIVLLSIFTTPTILMGIGLFILGHGLQRQLITVLAYTYMPLALSSYYYFMQVDLSQKSWIMMASGLLLLITRFLFSTLPLPQEDRP